MSRPTYDPAALALIAAFSSDMGDLLDKLGVRQTPSVRRLMWKRLRALDVDVSHWDQTRRGAYSSQELAAAVAESRSVAEVMRRLGIKPAGGSHFHISRRIKREGLDTSHFLGQASSRGRVGARKAATDILVELPAEAHRTKRPLLVRAMLESGLPYLCSGCGCDGTWRGAPLTLAVDHINGSWTDNRLANLRFLCPNCHAQTSTWCRRKGP